MRKMHRVLSGALALLAAAPTMAVASRGATGAQTTPPPPGPHIILTVPVELYKLPPEVDQYAVTCEAWTGVPHSKLPDGVPAKVVGKGSASGPIPNADPKGNHDIKSTATVGIFIDFPRSGGLGPEGIAKWLASATWYRCELTLSGTAYQVTTTYLDSTTSIPLSKGAPYIQFVQGELPK